MWSYEHAVEADVSAEAVWRAWADVERWAEWNADIEAIGIDGPFEVGVEIEMTPRGGDPVTLRIVEARRGERFVDEARLGETVVTTEHRAEPAGEGRIRIVYRTEVSGPGAEELGAAITADFPETVAALIAFVR